MGLQINHQETRPLGGTTASSKVGVRKSADVCQPTERTGYIPPTVPSRPAGRPTPGLCGVSYHSVSTNSSLRFHPPSSQYSLQDSDFTSSASFYSQTNFLFCSFGTSHKLISVFGFIILFPKLVFSENRRRHHERPSVASGV